VNSWTSSRWPSRLSLLRDGFRVFYRVVPEVMAEAFEQLRASVARHLEQGRGEDPAARVQKRLAQKTSA